MERSSGFVGTVRETGEIPILPDQRKAVLFLGKPGDLGSEPWICRSRRPWIHGIYGYGRRLTLAEAKGLLFRESSVVYIFVVYIPEKRDLRFRVPRKLKDQLYGYEANSIYRGWITSVGWDCGTMFGRQGRRFRDS